MTKMPATCPSCQHEMVVTQLGCTNCDTAIAGHYPLSAFARLSSPSLTFLETFIRLRGNVKEMERETGESYWAIRSQLDKVIGEMGFGIPDDEETRAKLRKSILRQLKDDEIDVAEATRQLEALGK